MKSPVHRLLPLLALCILTVLSSPAATNFVWQASPTPACPFLHQRHIMISWPASSTGFELRENRNLNSTNRATVATQPAVVGDLTWVKCNYDSIHGRIVSNWKREGNRLTMDVTIPINTTATVYVPARNAVGVTESGNPAMKAAGVRLLRMDDDAAIYEIGSGCYQFCSEK